LDFVSAAQAATAELQTPTSAIASILFIVGISLLGLRIGGEDRPDLPQLCGGDYRTAAATALPQSWLMFRINWRMDEHLLAAPPWAGRANRQ